MIIKVHKGERWPLSQNYLVKEDEILRLNNQFNYLVYNDLKVVENKLSLKIASNKPSTVKVHILGFNHHPTNEKNLKMGFESIQVVESNDSYAVASSLNSYFNQKSLSDEVKYVLERKRKNRFMGNTLEKPSGLTKRHFNKKTQAQNIQLEAGRAHQDAINNMARKVAVGRQATGASYIRAVDYKCDQFNNFLLNKGSLIANLKPNQDGLVEADITNLNCFGTLMVVVEDSRRTLSEIVDHKFNKIQKTKMALSESKSANKVYQYERDAFLLQPGGVMELKDIASTEMSMIEDLPTIFSLQQLLASNSDFKEWKFLSNWTTLEPKEKLVKYDKFISHELNLFTYVKDREFFDLVVVSHIRNKAEKTLIDYFLLGDYCKLESYLTTYNLQEDSVGEVNSLTVALLLIAFKDTKKELCEKIVKFYTLK